MTGHRPWSEIRRKSNPTEEELSAARKRLAPYRAGYPEPMIDSRRMRIANGTASEKDKREICAEDQVIREWNQEDARDFDAPDGERYRRAFSSDVGDENVERQPPPFLPTPRKECVLLMLNMSGMILLTSMSSVSLSSHVLRCRRLVSHLLSHRLSLSMLGSRLRHLHIATSPTSNA
jgi:hypothetical protein